MYLIAFLDHLILCSNGHISDVSLSIVSRLHVALFLHNYCFIKALLCYESGFVMYPAGLFDDLLNVGF